MRPPREDTKSRDVFETLAAQGPTTVADVREATGHHNVGSYVTRFKNEGLVEVVGEEDSYTPGRPRKVYQLTDEGREIIDDITSD